MKRDQMLLDCIIIIPPELGSDSNELDGQGGYAEGSVQHPMVDESSMSRLRPGTSSVYLSSGINLQCQAHRKSRG